MYELDNRKDQIMTILKELMMITLLKKSLILLGALCVLLAYLFHFPGVFSPETFFPNGVDLRALTGAWQFTAVVFHAWQFTAAVVFHVSSVHTLKTQPALSSKDILFLMTLSLLCLSYWGGLVLTFVQMGLGLLALYSCSTRLLRWSRSLAIGGLIFLVFFVLGYHLWLLQIIQRLSANGGTPSVSVGDMLRQAFDPLLFLGSFRVLSPALWVPALGLILILVTSCFPQLWGMKRHRASRGRRGRE